MPLLIDEPELGLTRRLFEGAARRPASMNPQAQFGAWLMLESFLRTFEQEAIWPVENPSPIVMQTYRTFVTGILALGEQLLLMKLDGKDKEIVEATVIMLREKLVLEFSGVTPSQSKKLLEEIFGPGIVAA